MARLVRALAFAAALDISAASAAAVSPTKGQGTLWVPCPVLTNANVTWNSTLARAKLGADLEEKVASECTFARVPLDHGAPPGASREIEVFVKRLSPRGPPLGGPAHAVWCLSGGPGDSSADDCEPLHALLAKRLQPRGAFEVFVLDHRGVARSARLGCRWSQAETAGSEDGVRIAAAEWPGCLASLSQDYPDGGLRHFSSAAAARDVHLLMERFRRPGQSVSVYGISYGTYWAGRYARLFPGHARAIVLDGVVSMSGRVEPHERLTFERWDAKLQEVGLAVLDGKCARDAFCRSKLGEKPSERAAELFEALGAGEHCAGPLAALGGIAELKRTLGGLLYGWSGRQVIPAILYRLLRCNSGDAAALEHLAASKGELTQMSSCCGVGPEDAQAPSPRSAALLRNVVLSEIWDASATGADLERWANEGWFSQGTFKDYVELRKQWPTYLPDASWNTSLETSTPVLLMNGDTDCQTPIWSAQREYASMKSSGGAALLVWPDAVHMSIMNTPVTDSGDACGLVTVVAFLSDPNNEAAWRNPPCRSKLRRLDFQNDAAVNWAIWGTPDAYEGSPEVEAFV